MFAGHLTAVFFGFLLDLCFGDPRQLYHPVRMIGNSIGFLEKKFLPLCQKERKKEQAAGVLLVITVLICSVGIPSLLLFGAYRLHFALGALLETFWCYQLLAAKSLKTESRKVYECLQNSLSEGRRSVAMIVGRDTENLDEKGVIKAAVETVAENTSDGVVAPLLYMAFFGAVGGFFYKAVNTMDSMIGYHNETYRYFGTAAARLDDLCNFIPARLSALFMIAAAGICRIIPWNSMEKGDAMTRQQREPEYYDPKKAWDIWRRDRRKHKSPNSAQTESVCAGALHIQLAGDACYFGKKQEKPFIGDDLRAVEGWDIIRAGRLMYVTSGLVWVCCVAVLFMAVFPVP